MLQSTLSMLLILCFSGGMSCLSAARAQSTSSEYESKALPPPKNRAELLHRQREARKSIIKKPQSSRILTFAQGLDQKGSYSIADTNFWGFHPRLDWISQGSGPAFGIRYWNPEVIGPVDLMGSAFYSSRRYRLYDIQIGQIPNRGKRIPSKSFVTEKIEKLGGVDRTDYSRLRLYFSARFRDRTDQSFYGTGPDSAQEDRRRYRVKDTLGEVVGGYQLTNHFGWILKFGVINQSLGRGRSSPPLDDWPAETELPGKIDPPNYFRFTSSLIFDFRDDPGIPHSGFLAALELQRWDNTNTGDRYSFNRYAADFRGYIPLGNPQRVIALRALVINSDPDSGSRVPFFLQPFLGGGESLRGFDSYRFQGDKLLLLQGEYRWEPSKRTELALFMDTGTVANHGDRLSLDQLKTDWGFGFRLKSSRSTIIRIDQAFSNEGARTQFRFSAVF